MSRGFLEEGLRWSRLGLFLLAGCTNSPQPLRQEANVSRGRSAEARASEPSQSRATSWGRRTLLYPVRWGRAEDLAETLAPILERMYGPGARIVAQRPSNSLLIVLPERDELLRRRQGGARAAPQGRAR
jgi:hypothetical protein